MKIFDRNLIGNHIEFGEGKMILLTKETKHLKKLADELNADYENHPAVLKAKNKKYKKEVQAEKQVEMLKSKYNDVRSKLDKAKAADKKRIEKEQVKAEKNYKAKVTKAEKKLVEIRNDTATKISVLTQKHTALKKKLSKCDDGCRVVKTTYIGSDGKEYPREIINNGSPSKEYKKVKKQMRAVKKEIEYLHEKQNSAEAKLSEAQKDYKPTASPKVQKLEYKKADLYYKYKEAEHNWNIVRAEISRKRKEAVRKAKDVAEDEVFKKLNDAAAELARTNENLIRTSKKRDELEDRLNALRAENDLPPVGLHDYYDVYGQYLWNDAMPEEDFELMLLDAATRPVSNYEAAIKEHIRNPVDFSLIFGVNMVNAKTPHLRFLTKKNNPKGYVEFEKLPADEREMIRKAAIRLRFTTSCEWKRGIKEYEKLTGCKVREVKE